jgi:hypothetical protein
MKALVSVCVLLLATPASAASPSVSFEHGAVVADGVTHQGRAVWFSIAREISRQATTIVPRIELQADADGDGKVRLELGQDVPLRSIWFAVDLETGEAGVAAPEGFPLLEAEMPGRAIPAALNRLDLERRFVYLVVVRPGVGAWMLRAGDGGASDEDGEPDGTLRAMLSALTSVGDGPSPPARFTPGDLLLVIDPNRMTFVRSRIGN